MAAATTDERDVADVELEVVLLPNAGGESVEFGGGNVLYASTPLARQMTVRAREVEERRTVRLMNMLEQIPLSQRVESPVHGRQVDLGMRVVNARRKIVSSEMVARTREQLDDEAPRGGDPPSLGA